MKRLFESSWQRFGLQVALLAGIGLAFTLGSHEPLVMAGGNPDCPLEGQCTFMKPNVMLIVDYSTSMNDVWDLQNNRTRWQVVVDSIQWITQDGSFLSQNTHLALMRFGHDPSPNPGTTIPNEFSGLVDGQVLDVPWYDAQNEPWLECNGAAIGAALDAAGAPSNGVGTWTKGALDRAKLLIDQAVADHPEDNGERVYLDVVVTDGAWTGMDGTTPLAPADQDPVITATDLFDNQNVQTYVIAVAGDPAAELAADQLASAGGTGQTAIDADTPELLVQALEQLVQQIIDAVVVPECVGGMPRVMVLLDASSSMLNVDGGTMAGGIDETSWDKARAALAGPISLFDVALDSGLLVGDVVHLGLAVFGHNAPAPGEQAILVDYGPCTRDNIDWALDPMTSCELPGCDGPWAGPPITWTFKDGQLGEPMFISPTTSHMPRCGGNNLFCAGSGTATHLGLQLIGANQATYLANAQLPNAQFPANDQTQFINILITDGPYTGYSTDAQVQAELEQMFAVGTTTHVIGFGDGVDSASVIAQLQNMADWGSGGTLDYYDANNQIDLEAALAEIVGGLSIDPCCAFSDCSACPEPIGNEPCFADGGFDSNGEEPDPVPTTGADTTTDGSTTDESTTDESTTTDGSTTDESTGDSSSGTGSDSSSSGGASEDAADEVGTGDEATDLPDDPDGLACNCASSPSEGSPRGFAGSLLVLGLAGLVRRRRDHERCGRDH